MNAEFETEVLTRLTRIETKLDDYDSIKTKAEASKAKAESNERRIDNIEDKIKWLTRTIAGAFITGGIAIIFILIQLGMKL